MEIANPFQRNALAWLISARELLRRTLPILAFPLVLVAVIVAIPFAVAAPRLRNAASTAALKFSLGALFRMRSRAFVTALVGSVAAVDVAVAQPRDRKAVSVVARELIHRTHIGRD